MWTSLNTVPIIYWSFLWQSFARIREWVDWIMFGLFKMKYCIYVRIWALFLVHGKTHIKSFILFAWRVLRVQREVESVIFWLFKTIAQFCSKLMIKRRGECCFNITNHLTNLLGGLSSVQNSFSYMRFPATRIGFVQLIFYRKMQQIRINHNSTHL